MSYDKQKLIDAIWQSPQQVTALQWTLRGNVWQTHQYPDGSTKEGSHHRADRTTLKLKADGSNIYVHCNGDFAGFPHGDIWQYLQWQWSTNDFLEVLQRAAEAYGIEPDYSGYTAQQVERAKQWRTEKELLKTAADYVTAALNTDKGQSARSYLQGRKLKPTERLGAWSKEIHDALKAHLQACSHLSAEQTEAYLQKWFTRYSADDYNVAIPYTNGGAVVGFCLRRTTDNITYTNREGEQREKPKYLFSVGMPKGGYCSMLKGGEEPIYLVEGVLDAEAMRQAGFNNVMALGGMTPTDNAEDANRSQIQTLQRYNAKKLYYIPDCEYNPDGTRKADATLRTIKALKPHVEGTLEGRGFVSVHIVDLETEDSRRDKTKVDADEFLRQANYPQAELQHRIDTAQQWYEFELQDAVKRHKNDITILTAQAADIYQSIDNAGLRQRLKTDITAAKDGYLYELKAAGLNAAALTAIDYRGTSATWAARMAEVIEEMKNARTPAAMARLLTKAQRIQQADTISTFEAQANLTREDLHKLIVSKPDYLQTSWQLWKIGDNDVPYSNRNISFAPAAVTILAAPTNHGKTLVLLQTAINIAKQTKKKILYQSFENDAEQLVIRARAANIGGKWNSTKNLRGVLRTFEKGEDMPEVYYNKYNMPIDLAAETDAYYNEVHPNLKLMRGSSDIDAVVNYLTWKVEQWQDAGIEAGGIFIDYLQLLHAPNLYTHSRTDEVKYICDRLNDVAKATALPVILAAQFNREATKNSGDKLDGIQLANIGESAGIENIAEDVYLLWQVDKIKDADYMTTKAGNITFEVTPDKTRSRRCYTNPTDRTTKRTGYLYVENLKARDYATGGYCLLPFNGAAGAITSDKSIHEQIKTQIQ